LQGLREAVQVEVDTDPEEGDPEVYQREKNLTLIAALEGEMLSIESALRAIKRGTYGICERCGEPIPSERLEVRPEATLCVKCQADVERLLRRGIMRPRTGRR
jgi:RNA polymerase-binding transcription factor DksA